MDFSKIDQTGDVKIPKKIYYCLIDYFFFDNRQPSNEKRIKDALEEKLDALVRREEYGKRFKKVP